MNQLRTESVSDVIDSQPQLLAGIRALERYKQITQQSTHRDVEVIVLVGESGSGKTRWAWDNFPNLYSKPDGAWWDGYSGQETVLLDDYDGHIPYAQLLKYTDRYPVLLPVKGGFIPASYTRFIITSNIPVSVWYTVPNTDALNRRIKHYHLYSIPDASEEIVVPTTQSESSPCTHSQAGGSEVCPSCWKRC